VVFCIFFFSSRRRHTRFSRDWSSDVCSSDLDKYGDDFGYADLRLAYVMATAWHETGCFKWLKEIWGPTAAQKRYECRKDLGNTRSEERRVGKEWRSRWAPYHYKKKRDKRTQA